MSYNFLNEESIASLKARFAAAIQAAFAKVTQKGGTVPAGAGLEEMEAAIATISADTEERSAFPSSSAQVVNPSAGKYISKFTVAPKTANQLVNAYETITQFGISKTLTENGVTLFGTFTGTDSDNLIVVKQNIVFKRNGFEKYLVFANQPIIGRMDVGGYPVTAHAGLQSWVWTAPLSDSDWTNGIVMRFTTGQSVNLQNLIINVIDLTEMYGAGNEPTAEEFEAMYAEPYYPYTPIDAGGLKIITDKVSSGANRSYNKIAGGTIGLRYVTVTDAEIGFTPKYIAWCGKDSSNSYNEQFDGVYIGESGANGGFYFYGGTNLASDGQFHSGTTWYIPTDNVGGKGSVLIFVK